MTHTLRHPDCLTVLSPDGTPSRGADQLWYPSHWQRRAGCGPTTASLMLSYLGRTRGELSAIAPGEGTFLPYMEAVWPYLLPGAKGLDSPEGFLIGCRSFAFSRGLSLTGAVLSLPHRGEGSRPSLAWCRDFLLSALREDCPAAFLNYDRGEVDNLDDWHWVPVAAVREEGDRLCLLVLDEGREKVLDFSLWWRTALSGGALVTLTPAGEPSPWRLETEETGGTLLYRLAGAGETLTCRLHRGSLSQHWLVSWPCRLPERAVCTLTELTLPVGQEKAGAALLAHAVDTARRWGGGALRLSFPAGEEHLSALCADLGFQLGQSRSDSGLCYWEKPL